MRSIFSVAALILLTVSSQGWGVSRDFSSIDAAVKQLAQPRSIPELVDAIKALSTNDWDRVRAAYDWVATNIAYDTDYYFHDTPTRTDAEGVFRTRKSVCQGYSELFASVTNALRIETLLVSGYAKGYSYTKGQHFSATNHAWNVVKLDGRWHFMDSTWGSGHVNDNKAYVRDFTDAWFDMDPSLFVLHHFPESNQWLLLPDSMNLADFEKAPFVTTSTLAAFVEMGGKYSDITSFLSTGGMPSLFRYDGHRIVLIDYPREGLLKPNQTYRFSIRIPDCEKAAIVDGTNRFTYLDHDADDFSGEITLAPGTNLSICAYISYQNTLSYWTVAEWKVDDNKN